ncbi:MAG: MBG domain-containing protein [Reichenbachiella sp.]|uniref:choice-of-anchor tandem repeat GloVer-containing protein n=1 Tax=Reichenbachiella sp. TaxID=2184521 RepID=UPI002965DC34|nr:choice-of-anchor tandem repeat GloVer-containing protein [Reichenbachiella sp.]MDW3208462.1 MBG domain-containing protein [Reichenbachiella sp.]
MNIKSSLLLTIILGSVFTAQSQINKIYGTTKAVNGNGAVFSADIDGSNLEIIVNDGEPSSPDSDLLYHNDRMWGLSRGGGKYSGGTLFSVDMNLEDLQIHHHFHTSTGIRPWGSLIVADGYFWGTAAEGGVSDTGVVFKINTNGTGYTIVLDEELDTPGAEIISVDGKIYGYATGGAHDYGIIFRVDHDGQNFESIHDFNGLDGQLPDGKMTYDGSKLWGVCEYSVSAATGSTSDTGLIFTINTDGSAYTVRQRISRRPNGTLLLYNNRLWGTSWGGGDNLWGSIFSIGTDGSGYQVEHSFDNSEVGKFPEGPVIERDGVLWGMTYQFGLYSFDPIADEANNHHTFSIYRDYYSYGGLVESDGHFWGTTSSNFSGTGSVFKIDTDGSDYESLQFSKLITDVSQYGAYRFGYEFDGKLLFYQNRLFGVMRSGGEMYNYYGGLFSVNTDGSDFKHLHYFELEDGEEPHGSLIALNGKIWGVNYKHGNSIAGTLFSYDLQEEAFKVELDFSKSTASGYQPNPVVAYEGMIYGTTYGGGDNSVGLVYSFNPETAERTTLHTFSTDGLYRPSAFLEIRNGMLYGRTLYSNGANSMGIYRIDLSDNSYEVIYTITDVIEKVTLSDTHFYLITNAGGNNSQGFIRKVALDGTEEETPYHLIEEDGNFIGRPTFYGGMLWGAMAYSGANSEGFIFTYDDTNGFQNLMDFDASTKMPTDRFELLIVGEQEIPEMEFEVANQTYGNPSFELEAFSSSGAAITYESSNSSVIEIDGNLAEVVGAGQCTISALQNENVNYEEGQAMADVEVAQVPLTITADDQSRTYGDENPALTMSYTGFVNGDNSDDLSELPDVSTAATVTSDVGTYEITLTGGDAANYALTLTNGTLTINKAPLTITAQDTTISATASIPEFQLVYDGFVNGDSKEDIAPPSISTDGEAGASGEYDITLTGGSADNYTFNLIGGTLIIEEQATVPDEPVLNIDEAGVTMSVYPNPSNHQFNIQGAKRIHQIEILDMKGKKWLNISNPRGAISIDQLPDGYYVVRIVGKEQWTLPLIKQ